MTAYSARPTSTNALQQLVNLTAHGFVVGQILIFNSSGNWVNAKADNLADCAGTWMVSIVPSVDTFYVTQEGYLSGLPGPNYGSPSNFTIGVQYYLSPTTGGILTTAMPSAVGQVILPCFIPDTTKSGYFYGGSGVAVGSEGLFSWSTATTNTNMGVNQGYFTNSGGTLNMTLPPTAAVGDVIRIANVAGNFTLKQNASQFVNIGNRVTTTGTGGSITSNAVGDGLEIICFVANTSFQLLSSEGNFTYV